MFLLWSPQIHTIIQNFQVELNSIQTIEVVSVIWVFRDHPRNVSISSSQSPEHYLKRLFEIIIFELLLFLNIIWNDLDDHVETRL